VSDTRKHMVQVSTLVNVMIYDKCCRKTVIGWIIIWLSDEDTVKDSFSHLLNDACKELDGYSLTKVHFGRDKNDLGNLGMFIKQQQFMCNFIFTEMKANRHLWEFCKVLCFTSSSEFSGPISCQRTYSTSTYSASMMAAQRERMSCVLPDKIAVRNKKDLPAIQ